MLRQCRGPRPAGLPCDSPRRDPSGLPSRSRLAPAAGSAAAARRPRIPSSPAPPRACPTPPSATTSEPECSRPSSRENSLHAEPPSRACSHHSPKSSSACGRLGERADLEPPPHAVRSDDLAHHDDGVRAACHRRLRLDFRARLRRADRRAARRCGQAATPERLARPARRPQPSARVSPNA